ncbi:hypothetical protein Pan14r_32040 [Crateriforma conspicua]|uniref:PEP-CTERM protein-sorting domain-containing protein n=1 Tax=Crateriforma conspicua TaxID=2527996 RepID=A0A5C5Y5A1_9PLAN|nr:hypothetical protein Pan14r_32040 [Crateriforma conspicua]
MNVFQHISRRGWIVAGLAFFVSDSHASTVIDFESVPVPIQSTSANSGPFPTETGTQPGAFGGTEVISEFTIDGVTVKNYYNQDFDSWRGIAVSQRGLPAWSSGNDPMGGFIPLEYQNDNDTVTMTGNGAGGSSTWIVASGDGPDSSVAAGLFTSSLEASNGSFFQSIDVQITQTAAHVVQNGSGFTDPMGSSGGNEFLSVRFYDISTGTAGSFVEVDLATFTVGDTGPVLLNDWTTVDLSVLGEATAIGLDFVGSDSGSFGVNLPAYVAMDNVTVSTVPEPSMLAVLLGGSTLAATRLRRRRNALAGQSVSTDNQESEKVRA